MIFNVLQTFKCTRLEVMLVNRSTHKVSEFKRQKKESELGKIRTLAKLAITSVSLWLLFWFYPVFSFLFRPELV